MTAKHSSWELMNKATLSVAIALLASTASTIGCSQEIEPNPISKIAGDGFELTVFDNSPTLSFAVAINSQGHILGFRETVDESGDIYSRTHFFSDGSTSTDLPMLEDSPTRKSWLLVTRVLQRVMRAALSATRTAAWRRWFGMSARTN